MEAPSRVRTPQAVLFACGLNSVRSPMAASLLQQMFPHALYVKSAGVRKGELDPFAIAVMAELGQDISGHKPITFEELDDWEGLNFDLIITLSPEAHHKALELTRTPPTWSTGRRRIQPAPRAIASRSCKPIAKSATPCCCASASGFQRSGRRVGDETRDAADIPTCRPWESTAFAGTTRGSCPNQSLPIGSARVQTLSSRKSKSAC